MLAAGVGFAMAELWTLVEGTTIPTSNTDDYLRVRHACRSYDRAVAAANANWWEPGMFDQAGHWLTPDPIHTHPVAAAIMWSAALIRNGVDQMAARHAAGTMILRAGFDWIMLGPTDKEHYQRGLSVLRWSGQADNYASLMVARYNELD